jgi:membrane protein implicated in regulation of membrane protease activity
MSKRMRDALALGRYHTKKSAIQLDVEDALAQDKLTTVHFDEAVQDVTQDGDLWTVECYSSDHAVTVMYVAQVDDDNKVVSLTPVPYQECPHCGPM